MYGTSESDLFQEPHYTVLCELGHNDYVIENEVHYYAQSFLDDDILEKPVNNPLLQQLFKVFFFDWKKRIGEFLFVL